MIQQTDLLPLLVGSYPGLRDHLVHSVDQWLGETGSISACSLFAESGSLVSRRFTAGDFEGAEALFNLVERCLADGTEEVSNGAATCFLENLMNQATIGSLAVPFLGPRSREYCRAWDRFTGVNTKGLS